MATRLAQYKNSIAVLDIASKPAHLLNHRDARGFGQGIEFTPEGDKFYVGSSAAGRIEVYGVLGEYELRKNQNVFQDRPRLVERVSLVASSFQFFTRIGVSKLAPPATGLTIKPRHVT